MVIIKIGIVIAIIGIIKEVEKLRKENEELRWLLKTNMELQEMLKK